MKRVFATLVLAFVAVLALAQNSSVSSILRPRIEIAECSENDMEMEVFYMNDESPRMYYLSLGNLGVGTGIIQIDYEPVTFTVTSRRLLASKILEFSIPTKTEGIVRATHVYKGNFNSLMGALKLYKGLHPKE